MTGIVLGLVNSYILWKQGVLLEAADKLREFGNKINKYLGGFYEEEK